MRVSLVARFVSHPSIDFGSGRRSALRPRFGLERERTVYHRARSRGSTATIESLRTHLSGFRFPAVGRASLRPARRPAHPFGLPRARRA